MLLPPPLRQNSTCISPLPTESRAGNFQTGLPQVTNSKYYRNVLKCLAIPAAPLGRLATTGR
jgi:hypothetical protein